MLLSLVVSNDFLAVKIGLLLICFKYTDPAIINHNGVIKTLLLGLSYLNHLLQNCLFLFFIHLKLELLIQFPVRMIKKWFIFKNRHITNLVIL